MARFDSDLLAKLKTETDIVPLIESYGTKLKDRANGEMIGLCPIHNDKDPSLVVNKKKKVWNCLGACGKGGDVIEWVMHAEKVGFRHAVELLRDGATGSGGGKRFTTERKLDCPLATGGDDAELITSVARYYHQRLKESPNALEYLQSRCLTNSEVIEQFQIGFVDRTLGLRLPAAQVKAGSEIRARLRSVGILRDTGHEHLRGCVVFPLLNDHGKVVQLYGRRVDNGQRKSGRHFYLPGSHQGIFNRAALVAHDELILCESIIDALSFWSHGYRNVTTTFGTNGLTADLLGALKEHQIKRLLLAFDTDEAGKSAVEKFAPTFASLGIELFRVAFPSGANDANDYVRKLAQRNEDIHKALGQLLRTATWLGAGNAKGSAAPTVTSVAEIEVVQEESAQPKKTCAKQQASSLAASIPGVEVAATLVEAVAPEKQPPAASPAPPAPKELTAEIKERGIIIEIGNRTYRVRGLEKNMAFDVLKLNVMVRRASDDPFYVDTFDLYAARARSVFVKEAAKELGFDPDVIKRDLGRVLLKLESLQDQQIEEALGAKEEAVELSDVDKQAALELLKQPNLIERILKDFESCGVVGEETNKLVGYLSATSRKLEKPLAVIIQSSSAAGKSSLMDAVLRFIPPEEQVGYSAMTGQSLFYMGGMQLKHKILSIAEEEGVAQASYALKLLQSEGALTIASTGKDPGTGRMETQEYHVEGPVMIFLTTTAIDIDEELLNRCIVLTVDENRAQTRAIHDQQRRNETIDGLVAGQARSHVRRLHQNAQRLLRPLHVVNPFAGQLDFVDDRARRRRDHMKYLALIRSIALLHQYQRPTKTVSVGSETVQYIEVAMSDIVLANRLADQVLGKSIDELPPQTRRLLMELHGWIQEECKRLEVAQREYRFSRRMVRETLGWNQTALKKHLDRLEEMEYLLSHRSGGRRVEYELLYDGRGREGQPTMCGLIDAGKLMKSTTTKQHSSPPTPSSSPLNSASSPLDHPKNTPLSPPSKNGKPRKQTAQMR